MLNIKKVKTPEDTPVEELSQLLNPTGIKLVWRRIKEFFHSLKYSFGNLIYWFPVIWSDRNWDHAFLTTIVLHKLKHMRDYYQAGVNVWSADAPITAEQINEVIELIEKVEADNYEETIDPHFNDWIYEGRPLLVEERDEEGNVHHLFNSSKWSEEELAHRQKVYEEAEKQTQADLDKAYGLIAKNIRRWWD